jgi:hypothetical protein
LKESPEFFLKKTIKKTYQRLGSACLERLALPLNVKRN